MTISYTKGTLTSTRGLFQYLFGDNFSQWDNPVVTGTDATGRRRRRYGTRQRSNARAGKPVLIELDNGEMYTARVTGPDLNLIAVLENRGSKVAGVYTPRGTIYRPQFAAAPITV